MLGSWSARGALASCVGLLTLIPGFEPQAFGQGHGLPPPIQSAPPAEAEAPRVGSKVTEFASLTPERPGRKIHRLLYIESIPRGKYAGFLNPGSVVRSAEDARCWGQAVEVLHDVDSVVPGSGPFCTDTVYLSLALGSPAVRDDRESRGRANPASSEASRDDRRVRRTMHVFDLGSAESARVPAGATLRLRADRSCWGVVVTIVDAASGEAKAGSDYCVSESQFVAATDATNPRFREPSENAETRRDLSEARTERYSSSYRMSDIVDRWGSSGRHSTPSESREEKRKKDSGSSATNEPVTVNLAGRPTATPTARPTPSPTPVSTPTAVTGSSPASATSPNRLTPDSVARHRPLAEKHPPKAPVEEARTRLGRLLSRSYDTPARTRMSFPPGWLRGQPVPLSKNEANREIRRRMDGPEATLVMPSDRCKAGILQFGDQFCMVLALGSGTKPEDKVVQGYSRYGRKCYYALETTFNGPLPIGPPPRYSLVRNGKREDTMRWGTLDVIELYGVDENGKGVPPPPGRGEFRAHSGREELGESIEDRPTTGCLRLEKSCQERFLAWVDTKKGKASMRVEEIAFVGDEASNDRELFGRILDEDVVKGMR